MFDYYANPARFMKLSGALLPWVSLLTVIIFAVGLYWGLVLAPADYQQGETVRIMFIHVPAAWMATFVYGYIALASAVSLIFKHPLADVAAKSAAPIGAAFAFLALMTGMIWGKPMWGAWWVWDARLTSVLVLFLLYLGYMALWQMIEEPIQAGRAAAILGLVGAINIPIIKFSVDWWNTLHQPASIVKGGGPSIHSSILIPLLIMIVAYMVLFTALILAAMRAEILRRKVRNMRLAQAEAGSHG
ncbi:MAG TPA: heme ABC transporter permease [Rhizobiales bacterium]|nr:heme ABC transporter permease [Hyphomicrobiales bacterium]